MDDTNSETYQPIIRPRRGSLSGQYQRMDAGWNFKINNIIFLFI